MKKLLLALGALATLAMVAPSCKGKDPKQKQKEEVKELSVNPTSFELYKGDKIRFALTGADVNVTLVPNSASYTLESSDVNVAKVEGKVVTAMNEGKATITVKAGDKTATVALTVKAAASFDKTRFIGEDLYIPVFDGNMKAKKAEIEAALFSKDWEETQGVAPELKKIGFIFNKKQGSQLSSFGFARYIHTPKDGTEFISCIIASNGTGTWAQGLGMEVMKRLGYEASEVEEKNIDKLGPVLFGRKAGREYVVAVYHQEETVEKKKVDVYYAEIFKSSEQNGEVFTPLSKNLNVFNPIQVISKF